MPSAPRPIRATEAEARERMPERPEHARDSSTPVGKWPRSPKRIALAALGVLCVGLAFAGVLIPGLPTTVFLIAASYLFARSCPWLEDRLIRIRWFRPYLHYLDGRQPMPRRARWIATGMMWLAVSASLFVTAAAGRLQLWFVAALVSAAAIGTWVIFRIRRPSQPAPSLVADRPAPE